MANSPTVEHLAISRATPNTFVFRPADSVETAEAWELALQSKVRPFSPYHDKDCQPLSAKGAYILEEAQARDK